jgi:hypothetical protein
MFNTLIKTDEIELNGQAYTIRYFTAMTPHGTQRYSSELVLGPGDRIIVDGSSLGDLEWRVPHLMQATLSSRALAARAVGTVP